VTTTCNYRARIVRDPIDAFSGLGSPKLLESPDLMEATELPLRKTRKVVPVGIVLVGDLLFACLPGRIWSGRGRR